MTFLKLASITPSTLSSSSGSDFEGSSAVSSFRLAVTNNSSKKQLKALILSVSRCTPTMLHYTYMRVNGTMNLLLYGQKMDKDKVGGPAGPLKTTAKQPGRDKAGERKVISCM